MLSEKPKHLLRELGSLGEAGRDAPPGLGRFFFFFKSQVDMIPSFSPEAPGTLPRYLSPLSPLPTASLPCLSPYCILAARVAVDHLCRMCQLERSVLAPRACHLPASSHILPPGGACSLPANVTSRALLFPTDE